MLGATKTQSVSNYVRTLEVITTHPFTDVFSLKHSTDVFSLRHSVHGQRLQGFCC